MAKRDSRNRQPAANYTYHPGQQGMSGYLTFNIDGTTGPGRAKIQSILNGIDTGMVLIQDGLGYKLSGGSEQLLVRVFSELARHFRWRKRQFK